MLAMAKMGHTVNKKDIQEIFDRYDIDKNGDITFEEFKLVFENLQ